MSANVPTRTITAGGVKFAYRISAQKLVSEFQVVAFASVDDGKMRQPTNNFSRS
jgi:hypothetical protein